MTYLNHKPGSLEEAIANQTTKFREDSGYQAMFKKELEKAGKGIGSMTPAEKKAFFNKIDAKYSAKNENVNDKKLDTFHKKLDNLVHKTIGKSSDEKKETHTFVTNKQNDKQKNAKGEKEVIEPVKEEFTSQQIKMAYGVANDKRYKQGNYDGAVKAIEKIAKGLSKHPDVQKVLKRTNEGMETMVPNKKKSETESDEKRKTTMTGEKPSNVDMEPEIKYNK